MESRERDLRSKMISPQNPYYEALHPKFTDEYSLPMQERIEDLLVKVSLLLVHHRRHVTDIPELSKYLEHVFRKQHCHLEYPARSEEVLERSWEQLKRHI